MLWLPTFFTSRVGMSAAKAGAMASIFDAGGVAGSLCAGIATDTLLGGRMILVRRTSLAMPLPLPLPLPSPHLVPLLLPLPLRLSHVPALPPHLALPSYPTLPGLPASLPSM